ncbi:hypothetical protein GF412_05795 [Candidatus Micrarchaeota archaeon]|nr:hypothetical protein [Candidatus Micrarchaeota archaeon]MBD3418461.1 hypothetical protein [Candidatus Micrarchaeota archaeon]
MKHKETKGANSVKPRVRAASAVFAAALSAGGCGAASQCKLNYEGAAVKSCSAALGRYAKAKEKLENMQEGLAKKVKNALEEKVNAGGEYPLELDQFNECIRGLGELSREVRRFDGLGRLVKSGKVSIEELERVEEDMGDVLSEANRIEIKLEDILRDAKLKG